MPRKFKSVPFSCSPDMVKEIDARAESLGMSRSAYIQHLVRADLEERGDVVIKGREPVDYREKPVSDSLRLNESEEKKKEDKEK